MEVASEVIDTLSDLKNLDIKQHLTIYFLIDVRVVYIITYAYISIINLISSTAKGEATDDKHSMMNFDVSDQYMDVPVKEIDDAILWNCRDKSLSIFYYRSLYIMAFTALAAALVGFWFVKTFITCTTPRKHGLTMLWQIAVLQYVKDKMGDKSYQERSKIFEISKDEIHNDVYKNIPRKYKGFRAIIPCFLPLLLTTIMSFAYMAYDLHPLACLMLQGDDSLIEYDESEASVKIKFPDQLFCYQLSAGIATLLLFLLFLLLVYVFYRLSNTIINIIIEDHIKKLPETAPMSTSSGDEHGIAIPAGNTSQENIIKAEDHIKKLPENAQAQTCSGDEHNATTAAEDSVNTNELFESARETLLNPGDAH